MKNELRSAAGRAGRLFLGGGLLLLLAACATNGEPPAAAPAAASRPEEQPSLPALNYYQMLQRMTGAEIGRERMVLAALPVTPTNQVRLAMVLGHPRGPLDFPKAFALLDAVLKSTDPSAVALHPLVRLLLDNYNERLRLEREQDKLGGQLKESQRKAVELQEKIDRLADIERTLPQRPRATRPAAPGGGR